MEFSRPVINQLVVQGRVFPPTSLSFDGLDLRHKVNQGSVSLRYADFTLKVTRSGYVFLYLFNKINFFYNALQTEVLPIVCEFISLHGNRPVEGFTYGVKNIQLACDSNLQNQDLLNYFRKFYVLGFPLGYEIFILDTDGVPISLNSTVHSFRSLRIKISEYSDRSMKCLFNFTYKGKLTVVLSALSDLPSVKAILEGWGSLLR